jgi:hypothetical protein
MNTKIIMMINLGAGMPGEFLVSLWTLSFEFSKWSCYLSEKIRGK